MTPNSEEQGAIAPDAAAGEAPAPALPARRGVTRAWSALQRLPPRYTLALLLHLAVAALLVHDWDGYVFRTAAHQLWQGLSPYAVALDRPYYTFYGIGDLDPHWYAYPPLPLLLMALTSAPAVFLDVSPLMERVLWKLPLIAGGLALAAIGEAWARHLGASGRATRITGRLLLFHPFLILVGAAWGMTDGLLMALLLAGLLRYEQGHNVQAGVLVAAATLVKPFPVLFMVALLPLLVARRGWRPLGPFIAAGGAFAALIVLPFLLHSPHGFWNQAIGAHLTRGVQGYSVWQLWPLHALPLHAIAALSLILMALGLLAVGLAARARESGPARPLMVLAAAAAVVLVTNRVVNEQYLVMLAVPLLILLAAGTLSRAGRWITHGLAGLAAAAVAITGFHFITFIPPDVALPLFSRSTDAVAHDVRHAAPALWRGFHHLFALGIPLLLSAALLITLRALTGPFWPRPNRAHARHTAPTAFACLALILIALPGFIAPPPTDAPDFTPAHEESHVAAFYYIWWHNPAHDPEIMYGNWFPVSQHPEMGYYTNNRGVHRDHARMMVENGIDTAIVSYHQGNLDRYRVFQEEATRVGLQVAPLIELNQVYDQAAHRPVNEAGEPVLYAAYRLDPGTRDQVAAFVLDLKDLLAAPGAMRIDGRSVIYFYDSYVSGVSFHGEDRLSLAEVLLDLYDIETLRAKLGDAGLEARAEDLVMHHPHDYEAFFARGAKYAAWREAHLEQHVRFWQEIREILEAELGPVFMVSGEAHNERAGFEAGTIKSLTNVGLFDGSFLYSPSFPWGNEPDAPFPDNFARWEDRNHWLTAFSAPYGHYTSTGIAPAYDDTVNRPQGFVIPPRWEGREFYDLSWDSLIRHPTDQAAIATFNEWFEGSSIEPSLEYGDRHLVATGPHRERFGNIAPRDDIILHIVHERASRTHPGYNEMDTSHDWGLRMITAAMRADAAHRHYAVDASANPPGLQQTPRLILVEGGRPSFPIAGDLQDRLDAWLAASVPMIVFGPDAAADVRNKLSEDCEPAETASGAFLRPGDRLEAGDGVITLQRDGESHEVGVRCGDAALMTLKPWDAAHPAREADCLKTILLGLFPEHAPPDARPACGAV